jgi:hypothetical protein
MKQGQMSTDPGTNSCQKFGTAPLFSLPTDEKLEIRNPKFQTLKVAKELRAGELDLPGAGGCSPPPSSYSLLLSNLELSDTPIYEP